MSVKDIIQERIGIFLDTLDSVKSPFNVILYVVSISSLMIVLILAQSNILRRIAPIVQNYFDAGSSYLEDTVFLLGIQLVIGMPIVLAIQYLRSEGLVQFCRELRVTVKSLKWGLVGFFVLLFPLLLLIVAIYAEDIPLDSESPSVIFDPSIGIWYGISFIMLGGILVPIYEELLMRGIGYSLLRKRCSIITSVLVASVLFGLYAFNGGVYSMTAHFIGGIVITIIYEKSKSLSACVIAHSLANLVKMG